ncbi:MAG: hypothetical protein V1816_11265 [Pseudomonadota bacterium]
MRTIVKGLFALIIACGLTFSFTAPARGEDSIVYLETIAGFCGSYLLTSYGYIATTADAYAKDLYPAGQVKFMMENTISNLTSVAGHLQRVKATNIAESDKKFVDSVLEVLDVLKLEAESLAAVTSSKNQADVEKFDQASEQAWQKIKKLLKIN